MLKGKTHAMKLETRPFLSIKEGRKILELRLPDEKRQGLQAGDKIIFENLSDGEELTAESINLYT